MEVRSSPGEKRLLVQKVDWAFEVLDAKTEAVLWSLPPESNTIPNWVNDDYLYYWKNTLKCNIVVNVVSSQEWVLAGRNSNAPQVVRKWGDRTLMIQSSQTKPELRVIDLDTNQDVQVIPKDSWGFPRHIRFSEDGTAVLLDHIDGTGQLAVARWNLEGSTPLKSVSVSPFEVAPNGRIVQFKVPTEAPYLVRLVQEAWYKLTGTSPPERFEFTVGDEFGNRFIQMTHTLPDTDIREQTHAFVDGGLGLVVQNQEGLNYYRIPPSWTFRPAFWVGLCGPVLGLWGISWWWRRRSPQR